jgi:hypothetical protein
MMSAIAIGKEIFFASSITSNAVNIILQNDDAALTQALNGTWRRPPLFKALTVFRFSLPSQLLPQRRKSRQRHDPPRQRLLRRDHGLGHVSPSPQGTSMVRTSCTIITMLGVGCVENGGYRAGLGNITC